LLPEPRVALAHLRGELAVALFLEPGDALVDVGDERICAREIVSQLVEGATEIRFQLRRLRSRFAISAWPCLTASPASAIESMRRLTSAEHPCCRGRHLVVVGNRPLDLEESLATEGLELSQGPRIRVGRTVPAVRWGATRLRNDDGSRTDTRGRVRSRGGAKRRGR